MKMMHRCFTGCFYILISSFLGSCKGGVNQADVQPPNILLIVADDLGYTDLGCYGGEIRTPNLDALARTGILNTSFYTSAACAPTRAMLLSGVDNHRNGLGTMGRIASNQQGLPGYEGSLNFDVVTIPRLLQANGYHTSMAGKWHLARPIADTKQWPDKRGFDRSFSLIEAGAGHFADNQPLLAGWDVTYAEDGVAVDSLPKSFYSTDYYTQKVIEYIDESARENKPFFSYVAYTAPHWPIQVPDAYIDLYKDQYREGYEVLAQKRLARSKQLGIVDDAVSYSPLTPNVLPWDALSLDEQNASAKVMEAYAAMVELMDNNIGKLIEHLKEKGLYDNTVIVFMSDNGAEGNSLWKMGNTRDWASENFDNSLNNIGRKNSFIFTGPSWAQVSSLPFKWYKSFSTEGGVRSPCIISYPRWTQNAGKINSDIISVKDLAPTFLELAGIEHPMHAYEGRKIHPLDGNSLLGWLEGDAESPMQDDKAYCWELYGRMGVRKGNWKAVKYDAPYGTEEWELYDLMSDPGESANLAAVNTQKLAELKAAWDQYAEEYEVTLPGEKTAYGSDDFWKPEVGHDN